jgi:Hsp70 protein
MSSETPSLGIDFGTTNSSMAWFNPETGRAEVLKNDEGEEKMPSLVYFGSGETLVGKLAEQAIPDPEMRWLIYPPPSATSAKPRWWCPSAVAWFGPGTWRSR